jgi:hypothetical protein
MTCRKYQKHHLVCSLGFQNLVSNSIKGCRQEQRTSKSLGWKESSSIISTPYMALDVGECIFGDVPIAPSKTARRTFLTLWCMSCHFTAPNNPRGHVGTSTNQLWAPKFPKQCFQSCALWSLCSRENHMLPL